MKVRDPKFCIDREIIETSDWNKAVFWKPLEEKYGCFFTKDKLYPVYDDRLNGENFVIDDEGSWSTCYLITKGQLYAWKK